MFIKRNYKKAIIIENMTKWMMAMSSKISSSKVSDVRAKVVNRGRLDVK